MTIEHRYQVRHCAELRVYIRYRRRRFSCATGTEVSDQGMFLQVRNLTMPTGTLVELELPALGSDWLIPAIVIHKAPAGIGVMFRDARPELIGALARIGAAEPPSRVALLEAEPRPGALG